MPEPIAQPVAFSHKLHAKELALKCSVCHTKAETSTGAGLPAMSDCMICHTAIATDRPEIQKLAQYADQPEPVRWARVYRVPYWVIFGHQNHGEAGIECSECHGSVSERDVLWKEKDLSMKACVDCHQARQASTECHLCHKLDLWLQQ